MKRLGENIKNRRTQLGLTQDQLKDLTGYRSRTTITKVENGDIDLTQSKLALFAKALKTTPSALTEGVAEELLTDSPFLGLKITLEKTFAKYQVPFHDLPEEVQSKLTSASVMAALEYYRNLKK